MCAGALGLESRGSLSLGTRPSLDGNLGHMKPSAFAAHGKSHTAFVSDEKEAHLDLEEVRSWLGCRAPCWLRSLLRV